MIAVGPLTSSLPSSATGDVFSAKVGDWAFAVATPSSYHAKEDIPHGFCAQAQDSVIMEYVSTMPTFSLPAAHLYDSALQRVAAKITDPAIAQLLQQDVDLRSYLQARKLGDVYE